MKEGQSAAAGAATEGWSSGAHGGSSALGDQVADDTSIPDHVDHDAAVAASTLDVSRAPVNSGSPHGSQRQRGQPVPARAAYVAGQRFSLVRRVPSHLLRVAEGHGSSWPLTWAAVWPVATVSPRVAGADPFAG